MVFDDQTLTEGCAFACEISENFKAVSASDLKLAMLAVIGGVELHSPRLENLRRQIFPRKSSGSRVIFAIAALCELDRVRGERQIPPARVIDIMSHMQVFREELPQDAVVECHGESMLPLALWFTLSQRFRMKRANIEVKRKTAEITAAIESSISGVRTAKAFANEDREIEKFDSANGVFKGAKVEYYKSMGLYMSGMEFTTGVMQVLVITVGGLLIMREKMDYVDLVTFTLYVSTFVSPLRKLVMFAEQYMQGSAGLARFLEIMRTEPDIRDAPDASELGEIRGEIALNDVSFHYDNGVPVLSHIDLHIRPGECLAVVGPTGGGKTTMCQLIPRFYDVCGGSITVDGTDIRTVTQHSLRRNIGILQQDVFMFAGTVRENIRYGRPDATDEEIEEAAKRAEIHQEILAMPDGYDSYIGERGVMLSGGQKQRISIARVFLKNPKVLILDEATSALDTVTEQRIQKSLDELSVGRTTIIIAHRLSTVKHADSIAVVEGEHIIEQGNHQELMAKNGAYAALCKAQNLEG